MSDIYYIKGSYINFVFNDTKALNSFRFKLTRQWVRVDSVQHASCFFARLIPIIEE